MSDADNIIYASENTQNTFAVQYSTDLQQWCERAVVPNTGRPDTWMGMNAHKAAHPRVLRRVNKFMQ
jgi:hypothetical protein